MVPSPFDPPEHPQDHPTPQDSVPAASYGVDLTADDPATETLRDLAVRRLKAKQEFRSHLVSFLLVNTFLVVIWAMSGAGFFWPAFVILSWGIGLGMHGWSAYGPPPVATKDQIEREMSRLRRQP